MKFFVTGVNGQLGHDVVNEIAKRGMEAVRSDITESYSGMQDGSAVCGMPYQKLDITDAEEVMNVLRSVRPDVMVHCAAYTAVDAAEENEALCRKVNAEGTRNIATACKELDIKMIYISTDYVFDGTGERLWEPDDNQGTVRVEGQTKDQGELEGEGVSERK